MRTFIAIDLTEELILKIKGIISYLKSQAPAQAVKWVAAENLHLTLKFLGEIPGEKIEQIKDLSRKAVHEVKAFEIAVEGLGMFPNPRKPRVIWLGILNEKPLITLAGLLDKALVNAGIPREKRAFSPHLTIGRIRRSAASDEISNTGLTLSQFKVDCLGDLPVETIRMYQSVLKPTGPVYTPLFDIPLNKV